jgi:2-C-methyl-D-erythritol 2,4-cyclodiphosphate synthase
MRVGFGFDAHRFDESRKLILGGVAIPGGAGLAGHSDADVLTHAIADALMGAAGLGDLGTGFPSDDRWKDASSLDMLREVVAMLVSARSEIVNVDATVVAESPRLVDHRNAMTATLAGALGISERDVSVKATTTDGMGFTGRGEGMAAFAVALIAPPSK